MPDREPNEREPMDDDANRKPAGSDRHSGGDYSPNDETRAGHRSFENTSFAADEREQTEDRNRVARGEMTDEAGEPPDPMEGRD